MSQASPSGQVTGSGSRYLVLVGAVIIQLILGTVYGYSIFWTPLSQSVFPTVVTEQQAATMQAAGESVAGMTIVADEQAAELQRTRQTGMLKYAFAICILTFAVTMVIAGRVQDVKGPRFPAMVGAVLLGVGFLIAGLMTSSVVFYLAHAALVGGVTVLLLMLFHALTAKMDRQSMPMLEYVPFAIVAAMVTLGVVLGNRFVGQSGELDKLLLLWGTIGFVAGAGIGFAYVCPIAALVKWFPDKKGLVSGVAVAGFGFGAYLFKGEEIGAFGFIRDYGITQFFLVHAAVCFVAVTIGAMMLRNPPGVVASRTVVADSTWQDTLRRPAFYVLWLMFFSGAMAGLMVIGIVASFVKEQVIEGGAVSAADAASIGAMAMAVLAIFNAVGRIVWGFASDLVGRTAAFVAMFILQACILFVLGQLQGEYMLYGAAALIGFNFGGNFALFPSATADLFGAKNLGANYGWVFTSYGIAGVVGIAAGNMAKERTGSYTAAFIVAAALCLVSAALAVGLRMMATRQGAKREAQPGGAPAVGGAKT